MVRTRNKTCGVLEEGEVYREYRPQPVFPEDERFNCNFIFRYAVTISAVLIMLIVSACSGPGDSPADTGRTFWLSANEGFVRSELDDGVDVNAKYVSDMTPLHYAAEGNNEAVVRLLLDRGADIHAKSIGDFVPLHQAALGNDAAVVALLLDRGADIDAKSISGTTPLHMAAAENELQVVELLLDRGAAVNSKSEYGTPLLAAAGNNPDLDVIKLLLDRGRGSSCNGLRWTDGLTHSCQCQREPGGGGVASQSWHRYSCGGQQWRNPHTSGGQK